MNTFFSVVIPLYNKENYISKTIESVLAQNFNEFEIIIVDDGSTDNSYNRIKKYKKNEKLTIIQKENGGVSSARNLGINQAKGKYIALIDADDYWYPNHLNNIYETIQKFPNAGVYGTGYEILINNSKVEKAVFKNFQPNKIQLVPNYFEASTINAVIWTSASAFSKENFYKIGEFNLKLRTAQDLDFFVRAALKFDIAIHPNVTMRYHQKSENNLALSHYNEDREYFIDKFSKEEKNNLSLKKYLDINRYALVIRCKMIDDPRWKRIIKAIDMKNLTGKQRFLIGLPKHFLKVLKKLQLFLLKQNIYLTAFKG
ncbi:MULTISPECIES: glycosyltransferase family 2 protein [Mesonia]|uniref:Glycosyltransferase EpsJ n=1 Tax=Mesonia oceanica TaxID=2687242 RepID=A0AC61Y9N6_9FLAO|nr:MULTISPECIES: glycosyltransferase [Mesonia]MAN27950.1 glycosyl transferase family 2 [Mesonia sp.]MAQ41128.1 glycosyl transferase family 2 [Mesonia sp.]VVV01226.1 putative glycosyltransferase EpsJ [Mesonia oceanica]|tara:strand:+ start:12970 stop:13911 length:942 start_codon:yes stop_codon:yes gene_type:complete